MCLARQKKPKAVHTSNQRLGPRCQDSLAAIVSEHRLRVTNYDAAQQPSAYQRPYCIARFESANLGWLDEVWIVDLVGLTGLPKRRWGFPSSSLSSILILVAGFENSL
ncbi:uncharacterized protein ACLA_082480 [Aspergillus clavatus NRRL 1]|uniref:Uncharacterized protein n=1 Tax=Aspergillus clavatus (strain ATCC 1007 / CBS 513.65 / DSM 816 / NCTC 3887 / NRRL 1 / QM 1276 / 107) TaxID=344612 RepID=A1CTC0_ASPCL|nr:uncharacterized protein ACLA_082480 [Aspergillus clavatus NRRL 1]EAW06557.1 hypothetical protein ACLA_082480 [Aspergillus clavatus NRRL 1]